MQQAVEQLISLFSVFAEQGRQILNCWGFERQKTVALKNAFYRRHNIAALSNHFGQIITHPTRGFGARHMFLLLRLSRQSLVRARSEPSGLEIKILPTGQGPSAFSRMTLVIICVVWRKDQGVEDGEVRLITKVSIALPVCHFHNHL